MGVRSLHLRAGHTGVRPVTVHGTQPGTGGIPGAAARTAPPTLVGMSDAVQTRDLWTFRRDISARDPNWHLVETDEEE